MKEDTINVVKALRARADVASADLNYIRRPLKTANDTYYSSQWDYPLINLPQAWDITTGKPTTGDVIVAVVDTGVFLTHPDLEANILTTGYDFVKNKNVSNDGDGIDSNPDDPGDSATPGMSSFHGTHVAGTIAAVSDNSLGVAGVSWNAKIMPVRVLGIGGGTSYDVIQGIRYAAGLNNDSGKTPMQPANIINLSLGGGGYSQAEEGEFKAVRDAGVIIIAAAGNENTSVPSYPASYNSVVSVSAVDKNKVRAPYSNYGKYIDVAAPGGDTSTGYKNGILSTLVNNSSGTRVATYGYYQGTSMAAPHMAGVVALMKAVYPGLTPDILDTLIASGNITEDLANNGTTTRDDQYGYGLIDALKAVQQAYNLANNGAQLPPVLVVDPSNVDFAVTQDNVTLTATNAGGGALSITGVTDDAAWLTVTASSVAGNGQGTYTATVDRTGLVDALYTAKITFTTDIAGSVVVPVKMFVGSSANADAGYHYMLLVNQATGKTIHTVTATSTAGQYVYSFNSVVPGNYYIVAGTDLDNDTYICDPGEACGGYPTLGQLSAIQVIDSDITGIDFSTNFKVDVGAGVLSIKRSPVVNLGTMKLWNH